MLQLVNYETGTILYFKLLVIRVSRHLTHFKCSAVSHSDVDRSFTFYVNKLRENLSKLRDVGFAEFYSV